MKTKVSIILVCLIWMASSMYATVYNGVCGENVSWTLDSETKVLTISGTGEMYHDGHFSDSLHWQGQKLTTTIQSVVIEPGVTSIGYWAFANCTNLKTISLPDGITVIEADAFYNSGLTSIVLPNSVTEVQESAFSNCKQLASCDLGRGIKHIGKNCFWDCTALKSLKWSDCLETIGSGCFISWGSGSSSDVGKIPLQDTLVFPATFRSMDAIFDCKTNVKVVVWNARRPEGSGMGPLYNYYHSYDEIIVGDEVEVIPNNLFRDQKKIDTIMLPESVESIGQNAFNGCTKLQYINIPENVQSIGNAAFYNCAALTSLELPESISEIYGTTFYGCKSLTRIHIPGGVTTIGESAFVSCPALDSIVLPSELTMIGGSAFSGIELQDTLVIPDKVVAISSNAFENWSSLEYLSIGKNVTLIADNAFKGDSAIKKITVWAAVPPMVSEGTLADIPDSAWLSVLPDSRKLYREHTYWGRFRMADVPDSAMIQRTVTVDAAETTADFTWPTDSAAHSYQIDIYKDGAVFCKLTLGNRGQLLGISFSAPGRKMSNMKSQMLTIVSHIPSPSKSPVWMRLRDIITCSLRSMQTARRYTSIPVRLPLRAIRATSRSEEVTKSFRLRRSSRLTRKHPFQRTWRTRKMPKDSTEKCSSTDNFSSCMATNSIRSRGNVYFDVPVFSFFHFRRIQSAAFISL